MAWGLVSIEEQARLVNGDFRIHSQPWRETPKSRSRYLYERGIVAVLMPLDEYDLSPYHKACRRTGVKITRYGRQTHDRHVIDTF